MDKDNSQNNVTDFDIQALVDGELDERRTLLFLDRIEQDPSLMGRYMTYKKQKSLLGLWWKSKEH